jgi:hypothetical protein
MTDPAYIRVNGKPLFHVIDMWQMRQAFGSALAVSSALNQLRAAAQEQGLAGVYIVGGFGVADGSSGQDGLFPNLSMAFVDGYDAVSMYGYPFAPPAVNGMLPFSSLSGAGEWIWSQGVLRSSVPFIPVSMIGWAKPVFLPWPPLWLTLSSLLLENEFTGCRSIQPLLLELPGLLRERKHLDYGAEIGYLLGYLRIL